MWIREMIIKFRFGIVPTYILGMLSISILLYIFSFPFFEHISLVDFFHKNTNSLSLYNNEYYSTVNFIAALLLIGIVGLSIAILLGISAAILLSEFAREQVVERLKLIIEYIELIPPVLFGYLLMLLNLQFTQLNEYNWYNTIAYCFIFGLMMLPSITAKFIKILRGISYETREGVYSLGATKSETAFMVLLPMQIKSFLAETIKIIGRTISEILIVLLVAGLIKERIGVIIIIFTLMIITVFINQYLLQRNRVHG